MVQQYNEHTYAILDIVLQFESENDTVFIKNMLNILNNIF